MRNTLNTAAKNFLLSNTIAIVIFYITFYLFLMDTIAVTLDIQGIPTSYSKLFIAGSCFGMALIFIILSFFFYKIRSLIFIYLVVFICLFANASLLYQQYDTNHMNYFLITAFSCLIQLVALYVILTKDFKILFKK